MSQTPMPTRPGEPQDPELRDRYRRDAETARLDRRADAVQRAAEVPPSRTPSGPIWVVAVLIAVVLVLAAGAAMAGPMLKQTKTVEQALPTSTTTLELTNAVGDVRVRTAEAGEDPGVTRTTEWGLSEPDVTVDTSGGTATLESACPSEIFTTCSTDWTVVLPEGADVDIEEGAGRVTVEGIAGDVDVEAGVGDIRISESTSGHVSADLGVGALWMEFVEPPQDVRAEVGVGGLSVQLPESASYDVNLASGVGDARNDIGSDAGSDRTVTLESGVGSVSVSAS